MPSRADDAFDSGVFRSGGLACAGARALVPGHLDHELSDPQSSELRSHLLDCADCRGVLRQESNLRRWFDEGRPADVPVPEGFAARVARRAFQGDPGIDFDDVGFGQGSLTEDDESLAGAPASKSGRREAPRGVLLSFLLASTTAAAAVLFAFAILLQQETLPQGDQLQALDYVPPWERAAGQVPGQLEDPNSLDQDGPAASASEGRIEREEAGRDDR